MGRKKPTPATLYDDSERTNDGYMKRAEGLYKFLNRCARPEWEEVRRETERWYAEFPDSERDLLRRFRKNGVEQHLPAWWELYVHRLFVCLGYKVKVHPRLPGRQERPDFLVTRCAESLYVEATTAFNGDNKVNPQGQAWGGPFSHRPFRPTFRPGADTHDRWRYGASQPDGSRLRQSHRRLPSMLRTISRRVRRGRHRRGSGRCWASGGC
jgi:hypothetical protein